MTGGLVAAAVGWYDANARDLPWREPDADPWAVLVSEIMLQQTPVARVLPAYRDWLARWPSPAALAGATPGDAVRQWGRLGYPRRALRLHQAAVIITERHGGEVPSALADLRALPGVGSYTAAAVAAFAFGQRHAVLDTNVRRVLTRVTAGEARPAATLSVAEAAAAQALLPADPALAARWSVAVMELGALICVAAQPRCGECPLASRCAWLATGKPASDIPARAQAYEGTDRQCRGRLLAVLRDAAGPVPAANLEEAWPDGPQRARALTSLLADGLAEAAGAGHYALPGGK